MGSVRMNPIGENSFMVKRWLYHTFEESAIYRSFLIHRDEREVGLGLHELMVAM
ncbi:hypothetical protein BWQ96_02816 [Gracilariopsis chorda]|uniref:Uncharacterized protein n=1 Tax=Gracilariopsis chorda TaxID=448386 RepID=A0A2V3IZI5_9FLOR|nr:hypothetical protein BWQ96_02816 [Gracilariopsis chorda]|eukprot:PXF47485.1 hypothetical protein BWQ96_02816 [Gracilariopsis chorda]